MKIKTQPAEIFSQYRAGCNYKNSIGKKGINDQSKMNERFFVGDQWYGAKTGDFGPLVSRNIIKRIGEYKISQVASAPISVTYSADGIPNTEEIRKNVPELRENMIESGDAPTGETSSEEISVIMSAMSDYFKVTAERVRFDRKKEDVLRKAYISGTGILYTYWDETVKTGLYSDTMKTHRITGDIAIDIVNVENICFGEPNNPDVQSQPYIDIIQRKDFAAVLREAKRNGLPSENIRPDGVNEYSSSGDRGEQEPTEGKRVSVITRLFKVWQDNGIDYSIHAVKVTENAVIKKEWDMGLNLYPISVLPWDDRSSCIYGDSEITYSIQNQIAINRALTSSVWGSLKSGTPIMIVNGDTVPTEISNAPGQIIKVYGSNEDVAGAIRYVNPPQLSTGQEALVNDLVNATLSDHGANDAALGNVRPDNAAAIIATHEAATQPMQIHQNRFYDFVESVARIWCDFWMNYYGVRKLKAVDKNGINYIPFNPERYKTLVINARVDVGAANVWSESTSIATLDNLYNAGIIDKLQYLERMPNGIIKDKNGLIEDVKEQNAAQQQNRNDILANFQQQYPEQYAEFLKLPPDEQEQYLAELGV